MQKAALVLLSGGQDSATCLAWALARFERVETIGFDYAQRRKVEVDGRLASSPRCATLSRWSAKLGTDHRIEMHALAQLADTAPDAGGGRPDGGQRAARQLSCRAAT